ncbi:Cytochrome c heme lyase subunit CcmF [hydrothermal vent metagenome]|uniref:Cytochrome c heme lyase subunit CcmF n=1 Tax=hydrothermal vent metagenome TaxID=652676 RepID=A0A3B0VXE6_9ZZZZ
MLAEIGQFTLAAGMILSLMLTVLPLYGYFTNNATLMQTARSLAYVQFIFILTSFLILVVLFVIQDFSVAYVWQNSNSILPLRYRISATWGAHEGSMLMWLMIQALWGALVAYFSKSLSNSQIARVLAIMGMVTLGFALFIFFMSNPFLRTIPAPFDGNDLNPLLQDIGLILHPPMLYMGYVGLSVPFAMAIAALLGGKIDEKWIRWSRPWTNAAWAFLTLGIVLGSWWAYYELGWGGWWFWDPAENASFLPWLAAVALIHVQAVSERRNAFRGWTVLLAIIAFSLCILGTFIIRSGLLTSVHAFASDPSRGVFLLGLLIFFSGSAFFLYALRAHKIKSTGGFDLSSRETFLLANSIIFIVVCFMVLLGTLFPMIFEAMGKKISIGSPYFGFMFFFMMIPMVVLLPFGALAKWRKDNIMRIIKLLMPAFVASIIATAIAWWLFGDLNIKATLGVFAAFWVFSSGILYFKQTKASLTRGMIGMQVAHLGVAFYLFGVSITEHTDFEIDTLMHPNETRIVKGYTVEFKGVEQKQIENYQANIGHFIVSKNNKIVAQMRPQKRSYLRQSSPMTEAAIDAGFTRDLYISLGEKINDQGGWAVRIYIKPFIRWMWGGGLLMMLGAFIAATDRRYIRHANRLKQQNIQEYLTHE